jgi:hypothetical protein
MFNQKMKRFCGKGKKLSINKKFCQKIKIYPWNIKVFWKGKPLDKTRYNVGR